MLKHIIRIENYWIRLALLVLVFKFYYLWYIVSSLLPKQLGGHPNKKRLLELDFYTEPWNYFFAAVDGQFVPK